MSDFLYTSFIPKEKEGFSELFSKLFDWVKSNSAELKIEEIHDFASVTKKQIEDINVQKVLESDLINEVSFRYEGLDRISIDGSLSLVGNKHGMGYHAKESGNLFFSIDEKSIWSSHLRYYLEREEYENLEEHRVEVLLGLSELFNTWVDLCGDSLLHSSFYTEGFLRTRMTSTMGFYTGYEDFVADYSRILIEAYSGCFLTEYLGDEYHRYQQLDNRFENDLYYKSLSDEERGSLFDFVKGLDGNLIDGLRRINTVVLKEELHRILSAQNDIIFNKSKYGFTLSTYPLHSLWKVYYDLLFELRRKDLVRESL